MERDTVIHLPGPEQAFAGHGTAPTLHRPQRADKDPRGRPELPGDNATGVPRCVAVRLVLSPEIHMPAQSIHRLTTDAAVAGAERERSLAIRSRWHSERHGATFSLVPAEAPRPTLRCSAASRKSPRQAIGPDRVVSPICINRQPGRWWRERAPESVNQHGSWENVRQPPPEPYECVPVFLGSPGARHRLLNYPLIPTCTEDHALAQSDVHHWEWSGMG